MTFRSFPPAAVHSGSYSLCHLYPFPNTNFVKSHRAGNQVQRQAITALLQYFDWNLVSHLDREAQTLGVVFYLGNFGDCLANQEENELCLEIS